MCYATSAAGGSLSLRDVEELLVERGLEADHSTEDTGARHRESDRNAEPKARSLCDPGRWRYLYRAIDSTGATIDFLLPALRDAAAAKQLSTPIRRRFAVLPFRTFRRKEPCAAAADIDRSNT
jgi:transposase, IS6 family